MNVATDDKWGVIGNTLYLRKPAPEAPAKEHIDWIAFPGYAEAAERIAAEHNRIVGEAKAEIAELLERFEEANAARLEVLNGREKIAKAGGVPPTATERAERDVLRRLCEVATPGPWREFGEEIHCDPPSEDHVSCVATFSEACSSEDDRALIVAARNALPRLLDALDRAEAERDAARARLACATDFSTRDRIMIQIDAAEGGWEALLPEGSGRDVWRQFDTLDAAWAAAEAAAKRESA